jgi:RyR domain
VDDLHGISAVTKDGADMLDDDEVIEIARVCHEANRAICEATDDASQVPWEQAAQWQRESAIKGVRFALANPDATPADQHNAWMADKVADGWAWGPFKDPEEKRHPCIKPYAELPLEQRLKDSVFRGIVKAMVAGREW